MSAANSDRELQPHQLGQHFSPPHERQALGPASHHFGIIGLDRRGIDHSRSPLDMGRIMANEDLGPQLFEPFGIGAGLGIGALDHIANTQHDLGNAAHAYAPYANKMHGTEGEGDGASVHGDHR